MKDVQFKVHEGTESTRSLGFEVHEGICNHNHARRA